MQVYELPVTLTCCHRDSIAKQTLQWAQRKWSTHPGRPGKEVWKKCERRLQVQLEEDGGRQQITKINRNRWSVAY